MGALQVLNLVISAMVFGFIWQVQLTHYPAFRFIQREDWKAFHRHHTVSISLLAMPLMLVELGLGILVLYQEWNWIHLTCMGLITIAWLNTFLQAVPLHNDLAKGYEREKIIRLVNINWIRTIAWTLKLLILLVVALRIF